MYSRMIQLKRTFFSECFPLEVLQDTKYCSVCHPVNPCCLSVLYFCCCPVSKSCPALCDPWTAARQVPLSFTISWSFLRLMSIESLMPPNHLILCHPPLPRPQSFPASESFFNGWLFTSSGQSIRASALVLTLNIQNWFPLGLTGLSSRLSTGLSRVFSNTTVQKHQFFIAQPSLWSSS